jgi:hypothetical protein
MKTKNAIITGLLFAAILPATAQNSDPQQNGTPANDVSFGQWQLSKGSFNIRGSVGYTASGSTTTNILTQYSNGADSTPVPNGKSSSLTFSLNPGYLIADEFEIGIVLNYTTSNTLESEQAYNNLYYSWNNINNTFEFGIGATKFFAITRNLYFKISATGYYTTGSFSSSSVQNNAIGTPGVYTNPTESTMGYQIVAAAGLEYFPSKRWGINFNFNNIVNYTSSTITNLNYQFNNFNNVAVTQNRTVNSFNVGAGLTPTLAIRYTFGKIGG